MDTQKETCAHCWIRIVDGKKVYRDGKVYHAQCYMYAQHGITVKSEHIKEPNDDH